LRETGIWCILKLDQCHYTSCHSGTKLLRETYGSTVLDFFYDENGTPIAMKQNGAVYYYITNLQGDVVRLVNAAGNTAAWYKYDPYGNATTASGSHATITPLRYRGYYYDAETGLYYCQSRYYDPVIGRWINADSYVSTGQGVVGYNMFAYCCNSPTFYMDPTGQRYVMRNLLDDGGTQKDSDRPKRDVTLEIAIPLNKAVDRAKNMSLLDDLTNVVFASAIVLPEFYNLVNHDMPWDIKWEEIWTEIIGTEYPGYKKEVIFCDIIMTPENIGNFTYGYLGYAYGIPYPMLIGGSYYAANFPTEGEELINEVTDWIYISLGYEYGQLNYLEKFSK